MSDATFACPVCGAGLPARARFCGECGTPVRHAAPATAATTGGPAGPRAPVAAGTILPWFIAGASVIAIQTLALILALRPPGGAAGPAAPAAAAAPPGTGAGFNPSAPATTDLSSLSPRQAADRLYDRIMRASQAGDSGQVQFFGPMALQAYADVTPLDPDARLHIGMINIAIANLDGAAAQADTIMRTSRTHLFGPLLKARVEELRGNGAAARQAYRTFLANYDTERRKNLPEYEQHAGLLTETKAAADRAVR